MLVVFVALLISARGQEITPAQAAERSLAQCDKQETPLRTIRCINQLVALGPQRAKHVLDDYFARTKGENNTGLYPLIRCIFDVPRSPGFLPPPKLGAPDPEPPSNLRAAPRFPYTLIGDIPLSLVAGYSLGGYPEPEASHFMMLETLAGIRTKPLRPANEPWRLLAARNQVDNMDFSQVRQRMNADILDLVGTAYRPSGYVAGKDSVLTRTPVGWYRVVSEMERIHMRWDDNRQEYVRGDGTVIAEAH